MKLWRRLASQSAVIFGARVIGAGVVFLAQAAIARLWGSALLGEYLLIVAAANLAAMIMPLGFHTVGTYFTSEYRARGERRQLTAFMVRAYGQIGVMGLAFLLFGEPLTRFLGETGVALDPVYVPAIIFSMSLAVVFLNGSILVGLKRPFAGFLADALFRPMLIVAAFLFATVLGGSAGNVRMMFWVLAIGYGIVALGHLAIVLRAVAQVTPEESPRPAEWRRWWRFAVPWVIIVAVTDFFFDIDLLLLAGLMDRSTLAVFGVCAKIFSLVAFGVTSVYAVTMPEMFEAEAQADRAGFHQRVGEANLVAAGIAVVIFAMTGLAGPVLLLLFGPGFEAGAVPLTILCLGLVMRSVFGPASLVLSIHDRPYASLPAIACGVIAVAVGNYVLVPPFGLMGAAISALFAITLWSAALWLTALRDTQVDVSIFPRLRRTV